MQETMSEHSDHSIDFKLAAQYECAMPNIKKTNLNCQNRMSNCQLPVYFSLCFANFWNEFIEVE